MKTRSSHSILFIALISACIIGYSRWNLNWNSVHVANINGDGKDYYSYLVSFFIGTAQSPEEDDPWYIISTPTGKVNIHTVGTAVLESPFFLIGYIWAKLGNYELNGYSEPFQRMISIAALFYLLAGMFFLRKLLLNLGFSDKVVAIVLPVLFFGTNLLNYTVTEPSMSHVYSFSLITAFLYFIHQWFSGRAGTTIYACALLFGLILITRPINGLIIFFVPFFATSPDDLKQKIFSLFIPNQLRFPKNRKLQRTALTESTSSLLRKPDYSQYKSRKEFFIALLLFLALLFIQSLCWYKQNGQLIQWTYKGYGFYFSKPHILEMLFSFRCGLFIYTPVYFISLFGFIPLFKQHRFQALALLFFFLLSAYIFSCWWAWAYYDGIGVRVFTDLSAITAILLAALITSVSKQISKIILYLSISASVFFYLIFYYQYQTGILPGAGMNYQKLKYIFMKTSDEYIYSLGGYSDFPPYSKAPLVLIDNYRNDFENETENTTSINNNKVFLFKEQEYGLNYEFINPEKTSCKLYAEINLKRFEPELNNSSGAFIETDIISNGKRTFIIAFKMNETLSEKFNEWKQYSYSVNIDHLCKPGDILRVFIINKEKKRFYVDDVEIKIYKY